MSIRFNYLEVGQAVEVLLPDAEPNNWTPHVITKLSEKGEVIWNDGIPGEDFAIPRIFVRPQLREHETGHYLSAILGEEARYDMVFPEASGATERVPYRDVTIKGYWRNPIRGLEVAFPVTISCETDRNGVSDFSAYGSVRVEGFADVGNDLRHADDCPDPQCGTKNQRNAARWFLALATTLANDVTRNVRAGKTYDEALDLYLEAVAKTFDDATEAFRVSLGGEGLRGGIALVGNLHDLKALLARQ